MREFRAVHLDPAAAEELQAIRSFEKRTDLGGRESFVTESQFDLEVEQRIFAQHRGHSAAGARADLRPRRPARPPRARRTHHDPRRLEFGDVGEKLKRFRGRPAQGVVDFPRLDHRAQPGTLRRAFLHRLQQRQEPRFVARARVLAQSLAERQMLRATLRGQLRRVGRDERERRLCVGAVFGEIEVYAANEVPGRMACSQKFLERSLRLPALLPERRANLRPQAGKNLRIQVLTAGHRRRGVRERRECVRRRRRHLARIRGGILREARRGRAQNGDIARSEIAPIGKVDRQRSADFAKPQPQQPVPGAARKRRFESLQEFERQRRRISRWREKQVILWRENGTSACRHRVIQRSPPRRRTAGASSIAMMPRRIAPGHAQSLLAGRSPRRLHPGIVTRGDLLDDPSWRPAHLPPRRSALVDSRGSNRQSSRWLL